MSFPPAARQFTAADEVPPDPPCSLPDFVSEVREAAEFAAGVRTALTSLSSPLDPDTIFQTSQAVFEADVARRRILKDYIALHRLRQAERNLNLRERAFELSREKYEFDAASAVLARLAEIKEIDADRTLAQPEKIQAVRHSLFGVSPLPEAPLPFSRVPDEDCD